MKKELTETEKKTHSADMFLSVPAVRERLADRESRLLYDARLNYLLDGDFERYTETVWSLKRDYTIPMIEDALRDLSAIEKFVIWGCQERGRNARTLLSFSRFRHIPVEFTSNTERRWGTVMQTASPSGTIETPVVKPDEICRDGKKCLLIIANKRGRHQIMDQILSDTFPVPLRRALFTAGWCEFYLNGNTGHQYFDVFEPQKDEVFIDAGSMNGATSLEFAEWCHGSYERIVAFEPNAKMVRQCEAAFRNHGLSNCELVQKAVWDREDVLHFDPTTFEGSARVSNEGSESVLADSIDHVLNGRKATFIKMDIEGSEAAALRGAAHTIQTYHPRLAISLYHKPRDVLELPHIIYELNPDYRFIIRHYTSYMSETVLYAF